MARLAHEIFDRQQESVVGFDVVFSEPENSSGLKRLRHLSQEALRDETGFVQKVRELENSLKYDARFARSLQERPTVLGYYLTSDRDGGSHGVLPAPVSSMNPARSIP